jgi:hypothetical protein
MAALQPGAAATAGAIQHPAAPDETTHIGQEVALAHLIATPGSSWVPRVPSSWR